jgi:glycosyltransferase involved in cell wall biosynthesis
MSNEREKPLNSHHGKDRLTVTVAICTWNRAKLLDQTLTQMRNLRIPEGLSWELLVVNNNCTDETDTVIARHDSVLPLRRILEIKQGLSHARNRAVAEAQGELLLWTDDDVLVDPDWLTAYVDAARRHPDAAVFGGPIDPWFERPPPAWILRQLPGLHGPLVIKTGVQHDEPIIGDPPLGANMAFRTDVLRRFPFDPNLGRCGKGMRGGEESGIIRAIFDAGHCGYWVSQARVRHYVVSDRLTAGYLYRYFCGHGETLAISDAANLDARFPWWALRLWCESTLKRCCNAPFRNDAWFSGLKMSAFAHGTLRAAAERQRRRRGAASHPPTPIPHGSQSAP